MSNSSHASFTKKEHVKNTLFSHFKLLPPLSTKEGEVYFNTSSSVML